MVLRYGQYHQRAVRQRHSNCFSLAPVEFSASPESPVNAGSLQTLAAELTRAVGPCKGRDHEVALLHFTNGRTHLFDSPDELVTHAIAGVAWLHRVVRP